MFREIFKIDELEFNGRRRGRILVIDHNIKQASFIVSKLSRHFKIEVCGNLGAAFLKLLEKNYSLLIMNIEVADIESVEWYIKFKHTAPFKHLPLIVLTNRNEKKKLEKRLKMGIDDYIMMPIDFNELLTRARLQVRHFKYQEKLRIEYIKICVTDMLTGLYNRKYLESYFSYIIKNVESKKENYVLCMVDIDNFKKVNDKYGHGKGDRVLQYISKIILENIGDRDFIG